ncbi:exosome complex component 10 isoform X1 [Scleropages formosus]|uniref:Exosome complex component 10 n=1 Tax=Scleropages formosus TaxID=113540 RepID=A0A8C9VCP5_SCLFO|nr:exosome component 10 isoform X1 [Scleropages formosus]
MAACGRIEMDTEENSGSQSVGAAGSGDAAMFSGFKDMDAFVKHGLGAVVAVTKAAAGLPQAGDEYDFYRSFPAFQSFCEAQGDRLLQCMSLLMRYHGCRAHSRDRNSLTGLEESFDLVVDSNDVILERAGILLDEASGVSRTQQPIMPVGFQPPKTVVSSWNRRGGDLAQRNTLETIRLLQAKNIQRPQLKFKEKVDNSNTPFVLKIFIKPNAIKPLSSYFTNKRLRKERPEDLDIPAALADFVHQQRTQEHMDDMFAHPYQYELDHLLMPESLMSKPEPQMYRPIDETPCKFIDSLEELVMLNEKLAKTTEFAVDLEHHSYRSFLGITCLMQISTRDEDFIIDTLELRSEMYILNETFTDPAITKVFHGADSDIEWLQKDFGLYVVNLFDTHQAARTLNLGRHSLDHLLRLYCSVDMDKRYQLADWRIRPLPQEMFEYARADTHYLLYTYDRIRLDLLEAANGQPTLIQVAWQKSKTISLKVYMKPIYTEHSYLELYRKQKTTFNTQQLTAFRLLYGWRDKLAREQDESTGYVLPNHMLTKISENLPKEPQGIIACCNPVPPLVRQQVNELHLLIQQARDMPLLKAEIVAEKKKGLTPSKQPRVPLFGPHDISHVPESPLFDFSSSPAVEAKHGVLFSEEEPAEEMEPWTCLVASAKITLFAEEDTKQKKVVPLTVAQQKACSIMESFENPFRMYLPSKDNNIHISKTAKYDPSSKVYEISNRWKLQSIEQQKKEAEAQQEARARAREAAKRASEEKKKAQQSYQESLKDVQTVRQQAREAARLEATKREGDSSHLEQSAPKAKKKQLNPTEKASKKAPPEASVPFKPFDYSEAPLKVFSGAKPKESVQFDPNKKVQETKQKKNSKAPKMKPSAGNRSMSYVAKSERGFRHNWPKR